ncbi:NusG domain II-containing protein [Chitinibacter sp. ZOR0017]|uniref:NusG domain II-containing protein n=1 Tax=Chitinibacter sp. ZOR0017 TaxID=1339254 RepID=UPI00064924AB|nr:NusG domain II-containing protein [Chitinibacter sp. ZOR0017]
MGTELWRCLRVGDWCLLALCVLLWAVLTHWSWQQPGATRVRIYQDGQLYAELDLLAQRTLAVPGPLGTTVVEVRQGKARIAQDPSPRQYCVKAGWLQQAGQAAICLPNRTSIELTGQQARPYDSLSY